MTDTSTSVAERPARREMIVVESAVPVLDTAMFDQMTRIARIMASSSLVPAHLNAVRKVGGRDVNIEPGEAVANCFLVVNQATRWRMDPFAVAQHTFVHQGKIGYEGKLVSAVINTRPEIVQRLSYAYSGSGEQRKVVVTAKIAGDEAPKSIDGTVGQWQTRDKDKAVNASWAKSPDQMLAYRGAREWARRWLPEAILGVFGEDELEQFEHTDRRISTSEASPAAARGTAGLREALGTAAAVETTTGTTDRAGTGGTEPIDVTHTTTVDQARAAKPAGTIEQRDNFVKKFGECTDSEILALVRDEANLYEWSGPDREVIDVAYSGRQDALKA